MTFSQTFDIKSKMMINYGDNKYREKSGQNHKEDLIKQGKEEPLESIYTIKLKSST